MKKRMLSLLAATAIGMLSFGTAQAEESPIIPIKRLSMETAQRIAQAAVLACREEGVQVAATVVDRGGHPQAVLRDVLAMDLTLTISQQKAYTALSFNSSTSALEGRFEGAYGVPKIDGLVVSAGGLPITAGGTILGGVGVSGAPSGETDEKCAQAGIDAVSDDLEMAAF